MAQMESVGKTKKTRLRAARFELENLKKISILQKSSLRLPLFRVFIPSEPFVSQPLVVIFVRIFVHFGFGPYSEAQQFSLNN